MHGGDKTSSKTNPIRKFTNLIMQAHSAEYKQAQNPMLSNIRNREQKQIAEKQTNKKKRMILKLTIEKFEKTLNPLKLN
jgi:hypothetical protein